METVDLGEVRRLRAHPASVGLARRLVRDVLSLAHRDDLAETAQLLVSEVVTNALVHAGTAIDFSAGVDAGGLRVEVTDGSTQAPAPRRHGPLASTGRGLRLVQQLVDRWGTLPHAEGKTVWFELSTGDRLESAGPSETRAFPHDDVFELELLNMPLLLHAAWHEAAEGLLREYLLVRLDGDDATAALEMHAAASDAMSLLNQHVPAPDLGDDPEELMSLAVEPGVSSAREVVPVPRAAVPHFAVLDQALDTAVDLADSGALLSPPIQPEMRRMRRWLCREVARQHRGQAPRGWTSDAEAAPPPAPAPIEWETDLVTLSAEALIAADDTDRIVAVSRATCDLLGYPDPDELLGRRLVAIIPPRYHQAHLAGFTLHLSNGRSPLLGRPVVVPALRSDGTEVEVELEVEARRLPAGRHLFVARMRPAAQTSG